MRMYLYRIYMMVFYSNTGIDSLNRENRKIVTSETHWYEQIKMA